MYYYCERTADHIFSEPLNSITNIAFIFIAYFIFKKYRKADYSLILSGLIFFIGVGSFLLHTFPSRLTALVDVVFILFFILFFLYVLSRKIIKLSIIYSLSMSLISPILYFYLGRALKAEFPRIGDSSFYIIILIHMFLICIYIFQKKLRNLKYIFIGSIVFAFSIFFRVIDQVYCEINIHGTHFIWHILNSLVLYYLSKFIMYNSHFRPKNTSLSQ